MKQIFLIFFLFVSLLFYSQEKGKASYYSNKFQNRKTASGIRFHQDSLFAAHRTLPFGTFVKVKNLKNNKEIIVRIVDRGPHVKGRIIDVSSSVAKKLDFFRAGIGVVEISVVKDSVEVGIDLVNVDSLALER